MNRYSTILTGERWDGKSVYKSVTYPVLIPLDSDIQVVTNETTYLDLLAQKYYKDSSLWWVIVLANEGLGTGRMTVPAGKIVRIPVNVSYILTQYKLLNR